MADNGNMKDDALAKQPEYRNTSLVPHGGEWVALQEQAKMVWDADHDERGNRLGLIPEHIKSPQQMLSIWLFGREIGVPPFQSMRGITPIKGKPSLSAELMLALAYQNIKGFKFKLEASNEQVCRVTGQRPGGDPVTIGFSISDAGRAGLTGGDNWKKYPAAMLRARATSALLRIVCPDAIRGIYTPDELGRAERDQDVDKLAEARGVTLPQVGVNTTIDATYEVQGEGSGNAER